MLVSLGPDGSQYGWSGDWGWKCNRSWYFSNVYYQNTEDMTKCLWIDSNGDQPQTGFKVHWPEFTPAASGTAPKDEDFYCNYPATLEFYTTPDPNSITYWVPNNPKIKRSALAPVSPSRPKRSLRYRRCNSHYQGFRNETQ
jgi:hypothetical protein